VLYQNLRSFEGESYFDLVGELVLAVWRLLRENKRAEYQCPLSPRHHLVIASVSLLVVTSSVDLSCAVLSFGADEKSPRLIQAGLV